MTNGDYNSEEDKKNEEKNLANNDDVDDIEISLNNSFYNEQNMENYVDDFYLDTKNINNDILEESQESNIANIGEIQTEYK